MPRIATIAAVIVALSAPVAAQEWPARAVTLVVPFAAGGEADVLGRIVSRGVSDVLGKLVVIENISGGGGTTGAARVAKAAPAGYTRLLSPLAQRFIEQARAVTKLMPKLP